VWWGVERDEKLMDWKKCGGIARVGERKLMIVDKKNKR
jgi:hypothetical protein